MTNRTHYEQLLRDVQGDVVRIGSMVEQAIQHSINALERWDSTQAQWIIDDDERIDEAQYMLEEKVQTLLATQQPIVATDLRLTSAFIAVAGELERMGDYAKSIARRVKAAVAAPALLPMPPEMRQLATVAQQMLHDSLDAFVKLDSDRARRMAENDARADELRARIRTRIFAAIHEDVRLLEAGVALLDVAHTLERVADRATNIGERVVFVTTATVTNLNP
jgi:phosphate transport system protein